MVKQEKGGAEEARRIVNNRVHEAETRPIFVVTLHRKPQSIESNPRRTTVASPLSSIPLQATGVHIVFFSSGNTRGTVSFFLSLNQWFVCLFISVLVLVFSIERRKKDTVTRRFWPCFRAESFCQPSLRDLWFNTTRSVK